MKLNRVFMTDDSHLFHISDFGMTDFSAKDARECLKKYQDTKLCAQVDEICKVIANVASKGHMKLIIVPNAEYIDNYADEQARELDEWGFNTEIHISTCTFTIHHRKLFESRGFKVDEITMEESVYAYEITWFEYEEENEKEDE